MSSRIKGITIEIGSDTTPLQKALKDIENNTQGLTSNLKDVNKLLKMDPKNTELLSQKQDMLSKSVENTKEKLELLKKAEEETAIAFKEGKIGEDKFNAIKREVIETEAELKKYKLQLDKISESDRELAGLKNELKEIEKALKFDKAGGDNYKKKLENLNSQLKITENIAKKLKKEMSIGDKSAEELKKLESELEDVTKYYKKLETSIKSTSKESKNYTQSSERFEKILKALGKEAEDFADVLGGSLLRSLQSGKADSQKLGKAFKLIAKESLGAKVDIKELCTAIDKIDKGDTKKLASSIKKIGDEADGAEKEVTGLVKEVSKLEKMKVGMSAFEGVKSGVSTMKNAVVDTKDTVTKLLDINSQNIKMKIRLNLDGKNLETAKKSLNQLTAYGLDAQEAQEALGRQINLNKNATVEENVNLVEMAGALSNVYSNVDLTELIQENNEIAKTLGVSNEKALALTSSLLQAGFPPEQLDTISEYSTQLKSAGYNAEEMKAILASGVETGTWNIDNLLDGLKEGRIRLAAFGETVPKSMGELLNKANISSETFKKLSRDVAEGGVKGKKAFREVAKMLENVKDKTLKNALGVQIYGTKWEDQGSKITDTILNMNKHMESSEESVKKLNETVKGVKEDPVVKLKKSMADLMISLQPVIKPLAEIVGKLAEWINKNPELAKSIAVVMFALKPVATFAHGLGQSINAIRSGASALKGIKLASNVASAGSAGMSGLGASAAGAGAKAGLSMGAKAGLLGASVAFTGYASYKLGENMAKYHIVKKELEETVKSADRLEQIAKRKVAAMHAKNAEMMTSFKKVSKSANINFAEVFNAIANNTGKAGKVGSNNAGSLTTKSLSHYKKLCEKAGIDFKKLKTYVEVYSRQANKSGVKNFKDLKGLTAKEFQQMAMITNTRFKYVNGRIIALTNSAEKSGSTNIKRLKNNIVSDSNTAKDGIVNSFKLMAGAIGTATRMTRNNASRHFAQMKNKTTSETTKAARGAVRAFENMNNDLEGNTFKRAIGAAAGFLGSLKGMFSSFKLPTLRVNAVHTTTKRVVTEYSSRSYGAHVYDKQKQISQMGRSSFSANPNYRTNGWNDEGGIYDRPTIIGVGERRPEFVGALSDLKRLMREVRDEKAHSIMPKTQKVVHAHTGTIRVEGYRNGEFDKFKDYIFNEIKRESRL